MGAEQADLTDLFCSEMCRTGRYDAIDTVQQRLPCAERIERPYPDQALQGALADLAQVDAVDKIVQIFKWSVISPFQDHIYRTMTDILDRPQTKADAC